MSFLTKLFKNKNTISNPKSGIKSPECIKINELKDKIYVLLNESHYVPRSEYMSWKSDYQKTVEYFEVLKDSGMLSAFCAQNDFPESDILKTISQFQDLDSIVDIANDRYINSQMKSDKKYFDEILRDVDPGITLDEDQRRVILTDEDYCLVIAGAGAGKTTTVAAKVKYLVEKKNINPRDILIISFTNKAVGELREKINKDLKIDCPIATFHSTGNAILHIHNPEKLNIVEGSKLYYLLQDYFKNAILTNESLVNNLILFFASYFDAPYEGKNLNDFFNKTAKSNFTTMRSDLDEFNREIIDSRTKKKVTINNEILRSYQEVEIANFFYLNNIDYEYEPKYPYNIIVSRKPYTPDFVIKQGDKEIYIEHFGITESGRNDRYNEEELARYKKSINDKVRLHKEHGTTLIYTFSEYKDHRSITEHLKEELEAKGVVLNPKSKTEIMKRLIESEESRYIRKLVGLICRFINNFKTNGYTVERFDYMYNSTKSVRSKLFLSICKDCYLEYERFLNENDAVDFEDMINESARVLKEVKEMEERLHFKYVIVDEYQDISRQRFDLTKALSEVTDAKIMAVGDDWQSIYAFSGSDISLFTKFEEKMGYAKLLKIVHTYRNAQDVIDIAGNFIQKNPTQIEKSLISPKNIKDPVIIYTYDSSYKSYNGDRKSGALYATASAVESALDQIIAFNRAEGKKEGEDGSILILGRYNFDGDQLEKSGLFEYKTRGSKLTSVKYPKLNITFMTVHMAKGLGYDNVIVVNGKNETYGFPSKIEDDPVLSFVIKGDNSIDYAEERRLFYVALTRTKNRVYFIAPEQNPSEFLLEIKHDYKSVILKGEWNEEEIIQRSAKKSCPICGYPLQYRYKNAYGLRLYICTNEPELCGFITNDMRAGKLSIQKCEQCRDGYLIAKQKDGHYFLGCTNYKPNKQGCNNTISADDYYAQMGYSKEFAKPVQKMKGSDIKPKAYPNNPPQPKNENFNQPKDNRSELLFPDIKKDEKIERKEELVFPEYETKIKSTKEKHPQMNMEEVVKSILKCYMHISEKRFFGITVLVNTLRGSKSKELAKYGLTDVEEYGCCSGMSAPELKAIIQWLLDNHFLLKTRGPYPVLHMTSEGNNYEEELTPQKIKKLIKYLDDPNRESFIDDDAPINE